MPAVQIFTPMASGVHIVRDSEGTMWFKHKRNDKLFASVNTHIKNIT